jgi:WhiB family redox-sensing transcriptional regulator
MPTSRIAPDDDDLFDWRLAAACADLPARTVFATRLKQAGPALGRCLRCPVARECRAAVAPEHSWFDGVCGGVLWRNGRVVARAEQAVDADWPPAVYGLPPELLPLVPRPTGRAR